VAVAESVGVAVEVEHDRSVHEAVEERGGGGGVAQDLALGSDAAVAGEPIQCALFMVTVF
jgi:hypothetical protein